jgi:hypothetical protein
LFFPLFDRSLLTAIERPGSIQGSNLIALRSDD